MKDYTEKAFHGKDEKTYHDTYERMKKSLLYIIEDLEKARKKYKSFDDKWELNMLKEFIKNL